MLGAVSLGVNNTNLNLEPARIMNRVVTPTRIIFTMVAGPMQVNITFMNPVEVRFDPLIHSN
jgi:hypothetical protein